jgi:glyoxylase-like metal-dependent hydrolase (beta-lactamase superfamily II)
VREFTEVADRVWVARFPWLDVNVAAVAGERGLVVVDTNASAELARETLAALRQVSSAPLVAAVDTQAHFDHTLGNAVFAAEGAVVVAHEAAVPALPAEAGVPDRTFSSALALDLGDRVVELVHPGRGHTDGDVVVLVGDAGVVLAGDLVEESAERSGVPGFGEDCFPLEWPTSLDLVLSLCPPDAVVVPGHGAPVGREFVEEQRAALGVVAETIRDLADRGVPVDQALAAADWPYPPEELAHAVRRGYAHLPRSQRRLPLI